MTTLVKADDKGRVMIRGTERGRQYLVTAESGGWWVMPAPEVRPPKRQRRRWAGSKTSLAQLLVSLGEAGLRIEPSENAKEPVGPCPF